MRDPLGNTPLCVSIMKKTVYKTQKTSDCGHMCVFIQMQSTEQGHKRSTASSDISDMPFLGPVAAPNAYLELELELELELNLRLLPAPAAAAPIPAAAYQFLLSLSPLERPLGGIGGTKP